MAKKKDLPVVSVIDRRLQNPFGAPSIDIPLKDGKAWAIRIVDASVRTGRTHQIIQMGWTFITPDDIEGQASDFGFRVMDNRIVRGDHGQEVIVKMPQADFDRIQRAKAEKNLRDLGGQRMKEDVAQRAAKQFGDEAAETIYGSDFDVKDSRVNIDLDGEGPPR